MKSNHVIRIWETLIQHPVAILQMYTVYKVIHSRTLIKYSEQFDICVRDMGKYIIVWNIKTQVNFIYHLSITESFVGKIWLYFSPSVPNHTQQALNFSVLFIRYHRLLLCISISFTFESLLQKRLAYIFCHFFWLFSFTLYNNTQVQLLVK